MESPKLEIACFNYESCIIAEQAGADRVELCADFLEGGTTPRLETLLQVKKAISIPLFIMIRPKGGNFIYSHSEFEQMKNDIVQFKEKRVKGFVFGILKEQNSDIIVHTERCRELVDLASPLPCTFHRAFDKVNGSREALETIIDCGFQTILTSGREKTALEGIDFLKELIRSSNGRITIMPGGGVRSDNLIGLMDTLKTSYYHSSAIMDESNIADENEIQQMKKLMRYY